MKSIKNVLIHRVFQSTAIIFLMAILILNFAFYVFSNVQYQQEIKRQFTDLYEMSAHLSTEESSDNIMVYLQHYTHTHEVVLSYYDVEGSLVFSNDVKGQLNNQQAVYYEDTLVGYLAVTFESSQLNQDMLYGFIGLNLISFIVFACGILLLYRFLKRETIQIKQDLSNINHKNSSIEYLEIVQLQRRLFQYEEQKEKQKQIYDLHIKNLAHDIKTPLSVIQIYIESLALDKITYSKTILTDIQEEMSKIAHLIPKFIELDYVTLPYHQDISLYVTNFIDKYRDVFLSKNIIIKTELEPLFITISDLDLERLIEHLVFNAFYYSHEHKTITITIDQTQKRLTIRDEGIGMSEHTLQCIMQGPYRAEEGKTFNEKGSGYGYQIINSILSRVHGNLQIQSSLGEGTVVTIVW